MPIFSRTREALRGRVKRTSESARATCCVALLLLLGCLSAPAGHATTFKIATISPDGSMWMKRLRAAAAEVEERTDGRVEFKFYPGGVMGDDKAVLRKIRVGQLHGAVLTAGGLNQFYPDLQLYTLPMIFRNLREVTHVRAAMDPELMRGLEKEGFVGVGIAEVGFAYAMSKAPVKTFEDIRSMKVWIPDGDSAAELTIKTFRITPIPLSIADVLGGLQTGLINSVAVPPVGAIALQWHTQLKEVFDLPLVYVYGLLTVKDRQFAKLAPGDQEIVRELMGAAVAEVDAKNRKDHERSVEVLKAQGLRWNMPTREEARRWQEMAEEASTRLVAEGLISKALFEVMQGHLADARARPNPP